jgi:hypothetical protein
MIVKRLFLAAVPVLLLTAPVRAGRVEDAARMLQDSSYKVRVQAALVLGRIGDPAALGPLVRALGDGNRTVRAMAAQSLGKLGSRDAVPALKSILEREQDPFVRAEVGKALAKLGPANGAPGRGADKRGQIYLTLGTFSGGTRAADPRVLETLRTALRRELSKLSTVTFTLEGTDEKNFAKAGRVGFLIDGNVTRLDDGLVGGATETNCDVKVMVARWPSRSIILWTSAGAAVQGGSRVEDRQSARLECLEASAGQLAEDLSRFLQSQGG